MKIRTKVPVIVSLLILIIGAIIITVSLIISRNVLEQEIFKQLEITVQSRKYHIETFLQTEKEAVKQLSQSIVIERFLLAGRHEQDYTQKRNDVIRRLKNTTRIKEYTYDIFVLNKNGRIIASSDEKDIGKDKSDNHYFLGGKQGVFIKDAHISLHKKRETIAFSAPVFDEANIVFLGIIVAGVSTEELNKITTDRTGLGETGEIYLINKDSYMITPSRFIDDTFLKQKVDTENARNCLKDVELFGAEEHEHEAILCKNYLGENVLGIHAYVPEMEWGLLAEIHEKEVFAPVARQTRIMLLILFVFLAGGIIIGIPLSRTITQPIIKLHHGTEEIIRGNLDFKVGIKVRDEIGQLSRDFDRMTFNLKKAKQELEEYSKGLEEKVKEKTAELKEQLKVSEQQRIATQNILEDFDEANKNLKSEITERRKIEESLHKSEEKYRTITENVSVGIYRTSPGPKGKFIEANPAMIKMFGYKNKEEFVKITVADLYQDLKQRKKFNERMIKDGLVKNEEVRFKKKDRTIFICLDSALAVKDEKGEVKFYDGFIDDITERKRVEKKLIEARQAALQASRTKSEFLASMSHEIRTPMNAIMGMADLLAETDLTPEQQRYVQIFKSASANLLNIINDILDISKVEAGQIELEKIDFNLNEIVEKTCEIMALRAHTKDIELFYLIEPNIPMNLIGDPVRLRQILVNLLGNAIKFTEKGEVVLHVDKDPQSKLPGSLLFTIADTGIGISKKKMKTIFDSFSQADSSTTRKYGGTGLGLTISKQLVELMQGKIWIESTIGKGSTFYFTGQFGIQTKAKKHKPLPAVDLKAMKILLVDDNTTNRLILRHTLTNWGAVVTEAEGGRQALAELKHAKKSDDHYTLVLLDSRMPGMGGFEVAERIKKDPSLVDITIMMLTSTQRKGDITKCQELKIAGYLVKPIKKYDLLDAIKTAIGKTKIKPEKRKVARPIAVKDKRELDILLVEDSQDNRFLIQAYLKKTPYKIAIAENGNIAVKMFKSKKYNLVLMDMQMPVMDGYTATKIIRSLEKEKELKPTPIIALTAYALKEEMQKSLDAGCTAHLSKPIKKGKLLETILKYTGGEKL